MDARLSRRLITLRVAGASLLAVGCAAPPRRGGTDADPGDAPGQGRGGSAARGNTGINDADPGDPPGGGRGGQDARRVAGVSDADPRDPPGQGRGGQQVRGVSDADPGDAPGQGRGTRQAQAPRARDMDLSSVTQANYPGTPYARAGLDFATFSQLRLEGFTSSDLMSAARHAYQLGLVENRSRHIANIAHIERSDPAGIPGLYRTRELSRETAELERRLRDAEERERRASKN